MKTIDKKMLDELIRLKRKYNATGDVDILPAKNDKAHKISEAVFGRNIYWIDFSDFVSGILGLTPNATNQIIYNAFEVIGFSIRDAEKGA